MVGLSYVTKRANACGPTHFALCIFHFAFFTRVGIRLAVCRCLCAGPFRTVKNAKCKSSVLVATADDIA
jgi:hypothetical protein